MDDGELEKDFLDEDSEEPTLEESSDEAAENTGKDRALERPASLARYDPLQLYIWEINKYPLLTREEERDLAVRYHRDKDKKAAYRLVTANLRLVVKIAMDFQRQWMHNLLDLIQEGNIGLMQAVKKFDPYRNIKFSYYASFWIKAYILKFIIDNWKLVKIGTTQAQRKLFFNLKKEKERLDAMGIDFTPGLISKSLQVKESEVIEMDQRLGSWEVSLEAPIGPDSRERKKDILPLAETSAEEKVADKEMKALLYKKLADFRKELNEKELDILDKRMLAEKPLTLHELGKRHHISRERVRQIEGRLLKRLKGYLKEEMKDFGILESKG